MNEDKDEIEKVEEEVLTAEQQRQKKAMGALSTASESSVAIDQAATSALLGTTKKPSASELERRKALAAVQVRAEDVALLISEFEVSKASAENVLRENGGDVRAALRTMFT